MYGGSKAPLLFPRYTTDYAIHKEVVRQLYIDGFGNFLFDMKKAVYAPFHLWNGGYKFTKVKSAPDFVKEQEIFHFGEKRFHRNDTWGKVSKYCAHIGVHFEYSNHFDKDEQVYRNACNMIALNKLFKSKIMTMGGKGSSSGTCEQQKQKKRSYQALRRGGPKISTRS